MPTKQPTRRELRTLVDTLRDLIYYSKAHLAQTTKKPGQCKMAIYSSDMWGKDVSSWGDLNAAIHRAQIMLQERKEKDANRLGPAKTTDE